MTITTAQIRGARGILDWSQSDLSARTGISATSIGSIENNQSTPRASTLEVIRKAFESAGIEFIGLDGVRVRGSNIRTYKGKEAFWDFYNEIYNVSVRDPSEILVSNVDEVLFEKWLGTENLETHVTRMGSIEGISYKIIVHEDSNHFIASSDYAEYRRLKGQKNSVVPFYVYSNKLAIILFNETPEVVVIDYPGVSDAYRIQFEALWNASSVIDDTKSKISNVTG